jgi:hypothetical protein
MEMDEIFPSRTGTMTMVALIKGAVMLQVLVPILMVIPTIPMIAHGLPVMRTLLVRGHRAIQSTPGTTIPQREMPIVLSLRTWNRKKSESFLLTHMPRLMMQETRNIARVELQSHTDANPYILLLTKKSSKLPYHPMFQIMLTLTLILMLLRRHQSHTLIHSLFLNNMSNITPHTRIRATGLHLRSYMHLDLITIPIIMPHRQ